MKKILAIAVLLPCSILAETPAERAIAQARQMIDKNPRQPEAFNALAIALTRRARENSDVSFYAQAEEAVRTSLALAPDNFGALRARTWILLGKHEFAEAQAVAKALNKRMPDDVLVYGFLVDANVELGNYSEAEKACNWMLKVRPGNVPALTRAAYLRELFGDIEGALDLMARAYQATGVSESEDRAWMLTQMAHLKLLSGQTAAAQKLLEQALALFPNYHYAQAGLAKVRSAQKRYAEAVELLRARYQAAPHPENLYDLAEALAAAGRKQEALEAFAGFETKSLAESGKADNSNRELIFYYADHAHQPEKALEIAGQEYARRRDVYTLDAYAWALHVNGRDAEASKQIEAALAVGVRDPAILTHAGAIGPRVAAAGI